MEIDMAKMPDEAEPLTEVEVGRRTVYVNEDDETAYVEVGDKLLNVSDLEHRFTAIEDGKAKVIDDYEADTGLDDAHKERLRRQLERMRNQIERACYDMGQEIEAIDDAIGDTDG